MSRNHKWYVRWCGKFLTIWMSSRAVGKLLDVPNSTVRYWSPRKFNPGRGHGAKNMRKKWDQATPMLGKYPDTVIAKKVGLAKDTVRLRRGKLGIPAFTPPLSMTQKAIRDRSRRLNQWKVPNENA